MPNPLVSDSSNTSSYSIDMDVNVMRSSFYNPLKTLIEQTILSFGYTSLKELAEIPIQDKMSKSPTSGGNSRSGACCQKCKIYEKLLKKLATLLLVELDEDGGTSTNGAWPGLLSLEKPQGMGFSGLVAGNQSLSGSRGSGASPKHDGATIPMLSLLTSPFDSFSSVTLMSTTPLTAPSYSARGSVGNWLKGFVAFAAPGKKSESNSFSDGDDYTRTSNSLTPAMLVSNRETAKADLMQRGKNVKLARQAAVHVAHGTSYSIARARGWDANPRVKETSRTIIARKNQKKMINEYVLLRKIGQGSTGYVVLVQECESKELFAMKIVRLGNKIDWRRVNAIRSEITVLKAVAHPNLVRLHEVIGDKSHNTIFLILQYISGGSIAKTLSSVTIATIPEAKLRCYTVQILSALSHLHSNGIFHRDIKPENILIDKEERIYLADFGVSAISTANGVHGMEGTPAFMAPEVFTGNFELIGELVDVWALGVTLYQLMYGFLPFQALTYFEMVRRIVNDPVTFPDKVQGDESERADLGDFSYLDEIEGFMNTDTYLGFHYVGEDDEDEPEKEKYHNDRDEVAPSAVHSSPEFKELIQGVLCKDPHSRWNLRRIWESAWLRDALESGRRITMTGSPTPRYGEVCFPRALSPSAMTRPAVENNSTNAPITKLNPNVAVKFYAVSNQTHNFPTNKINNQINTENTPINKTPTPIFKSNSKVRVNIDTAKESSSVRQLKADEECARPRASLWKRILSGTWRRKKKVLPEGHS
ncbi:protein kinase domain [Trypanosoma cruzi]|nr:protein kinase domain [Trypanosoma cruzi]